MVNQVSSVEFKKLVEAFEDKSVSYEDWGFAFPVCIGLFSGKPIYWWKKGIPEGAKE